jgi:molybdenum cofactor cytidylyltransferase
MNTAIVGILLAAGRSRRFGADKRLHRLADGTPMVVAAARPLTAVLDDVVAVVDDGGGEVAELLRREGLRTVANPRTGDGMGTSVACGVAAASGASGWIVALGDMPYVPQTVVRMLARALEDGADIAAPGYRGQRGHPVAFSARHAQELTGLAGDEGARGIISRYRDSLQLIDVEDPGVILDIDH